MTEKLAINSIEQMAELIELKDVRFVDIRGHRKDGIDLDPETEDQGVDLEAGAGPVENRFAFGQSPDGMACILQVETVARHEEITLSVTVVGEYSFQQPVANLDSEMMKEFTDKVGIFHLTPFIREGLVSLAARMRGPVPLLGLQRISDPPPVADTSTPDAG